MSRLYRRDSKSKTTLIIAGVVACVIGLMMVVILIRALRARYPNPKCLPTPFLKRIWTKWTPSNARYFSQAEEGDGRGGYCRQAPGEVAHATFDRNLASEQIRSGPSPPAPTATVDRNTSVRSVVTLPAYRHKASEDETILGREGERDGIDVVVEMPTAEQEEEMREGEMEALYQIRVARRRQIAEREERRRLRTEARANNDGVALRELRDQARMASEINSAEITNLREEHERAKETRQRAVSSVSYADVGIARLDGTRVRANSTESERVGLLSDAASIAALSTRSPTSLSHHHPQPHRARSSSILSIDTYRSQPGSRPETPRRLSTSMTGAGSSPELIDAAEADLGDTGMPGHSPPGYDDVSLVDEHAGSVCSVGGGPPSGRNSPYPEPPPNYPGGPTQARHQRLAAHVADLLVTEGAGETVDQRNQTTPPHLPSLNFNRLPQIVVEPSSARPRD